MKYARYSFLAMTILGLLISPIAGYIFFGMYLAACIKSVRTGDL